MCKTSLPSTARLLERKSHCHKNSPSDLARHWLGWGADATLPIGGSTARVAPLSLLFSTAPRSHQCRYLRLSRAPDSCVSPPLTLHSPREYVCHAFFVESLSVSLAPPDDPVVLSRRLTPREFVSLPLDRRFFRLSSTLPVSLSSLSRYPCLSPLIAPIYLLCVSSLFFLLSRSHALSRRVRLARAYGPRNSVEHTRRRAFDTLCSVPEGSVRRFRGEAPFSTNGDAPPLFLLLTRRRTHSLPVLLLDNKRINVTLWSFLACVSSVARIQRDSVLTGNSRPKAHATCTPCTHARMHAEDSDVESRVSPRSVVQLIFVRSVYILSLVRSILYQRRPPGVFPRKRLRLRCATTASSTTEPRKAAIGRARSLSHYLPLSLFFPLYFPSSRSLSPLSVAPVVSLARSPIVFAA